MPRPTFRSTRRPTRRPTPRPGAAARSLLLALLAACGGGPTAPDRPTPVTPPADTALALPALPREFRGVWIATVANIDWPSTASRGDAARQQRELGDLLDRAAAAGLNAVVLQVRPAGDALYRSTLEPWSVSLTGRQGTDPGYDPLEFAVAQAHARGLELHAWFNPYRAGSTRDTAGFVAPHVFRTRRDLVRVYDANVWMDPGEPEVADRTLAVIRDVVSRYDVDGVHLDDFFYPYQVQVNGRTLGFPDTATYRRLAPAGLSQDDWRRDNVNRFVERFYAGVHAVKPWVKVGISPFGIWRPNNPPGIVGLDAWGTIYADSRLWLQRGWVDYFSPQLYWAIDPPAQSYPALLGWWLDQNAQRRHVWPGNGTYRVYEGTTPFAPGEMLRQVQLTRDAAARGATGNLFYNATSLLVTSGGDQATRLGSGPYVERAVVPASPWLDAAPPARPTVSATAASDAQGGSAWTVALRGTDADLRWWAVRARIGGAWAPLQLVPADRATALVRTSAARATLDAVVAWAVDRAGNASEPAVWRP